MYKCWTFARRLSRAHWLCFPTFEALCCTFFSNGSQLHLLVDFGEDLRVAEQVVLVLANLDWASAVLF